MRKKLSFFGAVWVVGAMWAVGPHPLIAKRAVIRY